MSNNSDSLSKSNPSKLICVISPCDYLYQGYKLISNMEGIETKRVIFKDMQKKLNILIYSIRIGMLRSQYVLMVIYAQFTYIERMY